MSEEAYDINNPTVVGEYVPDYNPEEAPKQVLPAPPPEGYHYVATWLNSNKENPVYIKDIFNAQGDKIGEKTLADLSVRYYNPATGELGQYLRNYYPSSAPIGPKKGAHLPYLCFLAGKKMPPGLKTSLMKAHVERVYAEAGDQGVILLAKTRWIMSIPMVDKDTGLPVYEGEYVKRQDIKGEANIKARAVEAAKLEAETFVLEEGETPDELAERRAAHIEDAPLTAHIFVDPVQGVEKSAMSEIVELADPKDFQ